MTMKIIDKDELYPFYTLEEPTGVSLAGKVYDNVGSQFDIPTDLVERYITCMAEFVKIQAELEILHEGAEK